MMKGRLVVVKSGSSSVHKLETREWSIAVGNRCEDDEYWFCLS